jgi:thiamine biosynthesis lipoprotein
VAAASCLDANIASTAAIIRGQTALTWLEALGLAARLVDDAGEVLRVGEWPAEGDDCNTAAGDPHPAPVRA